MEKEIVIGDKIYKFNLKYKDKKSISIKIDNYGKINVSAPSFLKEEEVFNFINKKQDWLVKNVTKITKDVKELFLRNYENGDKFLYLGKEYILKVVTNKAKVWIEIIENELIIYLKRYDKEIIKFYLNKWYREKSLEIIGERTMEHAKLTSLFPSKIIIKDQKSRWGSCNYKEELRLNWRLVMMPVEVMDYVIIHELCHIKHMNHSKEFWDLVSYYMDDYKDKMRWLKENGNRIMIE